MPQDAAAELARRLRELRVRLGVTQGQLAHVLGVSEPLISSWENDRRPTTPPIRRLRECAEVFATYRVDSGGRLRRLPDQDPAAQQAEGVHVLERELIDLRARAGRQRPAGADVVGAAEVWSFPDVSELTVVCGKLPDDMRNKMPYTDRDDPDYVRLYNFADVDSLIEVHGYIRAVNPHLLVRFKVAPTLTEEDYKGHLVLLGGVDFNAATRRIMTKVDMPVVQGSFYGATVDPGFQVRTAGGVETFAATLDAPYRPGGKGSLREDIGQFVRGPNPFNRARTFTICNGMYSRGVLGAVRALTDEDFRARNTAFIRQMFPEGSTYCVLFGVEPFEETVHTPDWTAPGSVRHIWWNA